MLRMILYVRSRKGRIADIDYCTTTVQKLNPNESWCSRQLWDISVKSSCLPSDRSGSRAWAHQIFALHRVRAGDRHAHWRQSWKLLTRQLSKPGVDEFCWILLNFVECLLNSVECCWILLNVVEFCWLLFCNPDRLKVVMLPLLSMGAAPLYAVWIGSHMVLTDVVL